MPSSCRLPGIIGGMLTLQRGAGGSSLPMLDRWQQEQWRRHAATGLAAVLPDMVFRAAPATPAPPCWCKLDVARHLVHPCGGPPPAGAVYSRGGIAEVGAPLQLPVGESLEGADGVVLRLRSDEHPYTCVLRAAGGAVYTNRFGTRNGYNTLRLPFNTFRPVNAEDPPLRPGEGPSCPFLVPQKRHMTVAWGRGRVPKSHVLLEQSQTKEAVLYAM